MNLKQIRDAIYAQVDWAPSQSTTATARLDGFINRAQRLLAMDAPFAFFATEVRLGTQPDFVPSVVGDTLSSVDNAWTVQRDISTSEAASLGATYWQDTNTHVWDGRMLEVTRDGVKYRHRIREAWREGIDERFTLFNPTHGDDFYDEVTYRVYTDAYYLPGDVIQVQSVRLHYSGETTPLEPLGRDQAERLSLLDVPSQIATGRPRAWFKKEPFQLPAPTLAPNIALAAGNWTGGQSGWQPAGQFEYCYTYAWGYRDLFEAKEAGFDLDVSAIINGFDDTTTKPLWESAPSPVTAITVTHGAAGARLTLPNIDYMQGMDSQITDSPYLSGWRKRIYRKRKTSQGGGTTVESPDTFFLVAEIRGNDTSWDDTGVAVPDYFARLPDHVGYFAFGLHPRPDARYILDIRYIRRPPEMTDDSDTPLVHEEACEAIIHRALALLYESEGNVVMRDRSLLAYQELLRTLSKRYGSDVPSNTVQKRIAGKAFRRGQYLRKWYET